jgi:glutamyl-tRNA synthetase
MDRVHKAGAKFDFEKAKWFNHEWIKKLPASTYLPQVKEMFAQNNITIHDDALLDTVLNLVKDRCTFLTDFVQQAAFFFTAPANVDTAAIKPKWDDAKNLFFTELIRAWQLSTLWEASDLEKEFKELAAANQLKPGELMLPFRIMLVGGKFGPGVFDIAAVIGREETLERIQDTLRLLK